MKALKVAAGVLALADSALGMYFATIPLTGNVVIFQSLLLWVGAFLFVDSLLCIYGVYYAFPVAVALSAILAADSPLTMSGSLIQESALVVLSLLALAFNVLAFRSKSVLSEQANPMNLPVFG